MILLAGCSAYDPSLLGPRRTAPRTATDGGARSVTCTVGADLTICERPNADGVCLDGKCSIVRCRDRFVDCDMLADNGCEATLDTLEHCGVCGASCALDHVARSVCTPDAVGGPCLIDHGCREGDATCVAGAPENGCEAGFSDCDRIAANGCETSLHTLGNCGGCGMSCSIAAAEASCEGGTCALLGCTAGSGDCDGHGCKSLATDAANCGTCGNACGGSNPRCAGGHCTAEHCDSGRGDCDGMSANGCEADLTAPATCGNCDVKCGPYANAQPGCSDARCSVASCLAGFGDCNGLRDDGCETDLTLNASCGACGNNCSTLAHVVSASCAGGLCASLKCEDGWGDCDGDPKTGCEQPLRTADHCGTCAGTCMPGHATGDCSTGSCAITACAQGFDDCNHMVSDGCEAALDSDSSCGTCGNACKSGTSCLNGGCACSSGGGCASGTECCSGACIDTRSTCFVWPCIPGTTRDKNNCGGCGTKCLTWCCAG